jgi:hypothetical protein
MPPSDASKREAQQVVSLAAAGVDTQLTNDLLAAIDDGGSVGTLVRVDSNDKHDALLMAVRCSGATAGRPDEGVVALASFEPRRSQKPGGRPLRSKANQTGGRAFLRPPARPSDATSNPSRLQSTLHQGNRCAFRPTTRDLGDTTANAVPGAGFRRGLLGISISVNRWMTDWPLVDR